MGGLWWFSHSVVSDSMRPHELKPARLLCPWDSPGKNTGVGCISFSGGSSWPRLVAWSKSHKFSGPISSLTVIRPWTRFIQQMFCCSVAQSCLTLWDPLDCSTPGFPVFHHLLKFAQIHVHWVSDAIQPSHPLSSPSPPAFNLSKHKGLFQWVSSSHQVSKVLKLQLQHQSLQRIFRVDFL